MGLQWAITPLFYFGYVTAALVLILPVFNTFKKVLSMKSVGGGTRVEPFVASLLGYACSFMLVLFNNKGGFKELIGDESFWISGVATLIYIVYLIIFLRFADNTVRLTTQWVWTPTTLTYLGVTMIVGLLDQSKVGLKWMCMIAGVVSSGTPLFIAYFVLERSAENLPDWFSSSSGLLHYIVWILRALPKPDPYDLVQNASGALSSLAFLVLLIMWRTQNEQRGEEHEHLLGNHQDQVEIRVEDLQGGDNQGRDSDNVLLGANQPEVNEQQLPVARTSASAPGTPEKVAIHRRSFSA